MRQVIQNVTIKCQNFKIFKMFFILKICSWSNSILLVSCSNLFSEKVRFDNMPNLNISTVNNNYVNSSNFWTDGFNKFCQSCSLVPTHYSHDYFFTLKCVYVLYLHIKVIHGVSIKINVFVLRCGNYLLKRGFVLNSRPRLYLFFWGQPSMVLYIRRWKIEA